MLRISDAWIFEDLADASPAPATIGEARAGARLVDLKRPTYVSAQDLRVESRGSLAT
jgi:hypothetical protein